MNQALLLLLALLSVNVFLLFSFALRRWPEIGGFACALGVVTAWEIPNPPPIVTVSGNNIYLVDLLSLAFLTVGAPRFNEMVRRMGIVAWAWMILGLLIVGSFVAGLGSEPFGETVNEFRSYIYVYAAFTWAMTLDWRRAQQSKLMIRASAQIGWALVAVACYHYALYGLGSTSTFVDPGTGIEQTTRPLISGQALILLVCSVISLWRWTETKRRLFLFSAVIFLGVVLLSQQRTVWAVGVAVAVVTFLCVRAKGKLLFLSIVAFCALTVAALAQGPASSLITQLENAALNQGTYDARINSWSALVAQQFGLGPIATIFGQPMGAGFGRFEGDDRWVEFAPHNWYVTIYLRTGIVGLLLLVVLIAWAMRHASRRPIALASLTIIVALTIYGWAYSWPWYVCLPWGWAINQDLDLGGFDPSKNGSLGVLVAAPKAYLR